MTKKVLKTTKIKLNCNIAKKRFLERTHCFSYRIILMGHTSVFAFIFARASRIFGLHFDFVKAIVCKCRMHKRLYVAWNVSM